MFCMTLYLIKESKYSQTIRFRHSLTDSTILLVEVNKMDFSWIFLNIDIPNEFLSVQSIYKWSITFLCIRSTNHNF